MYDNQIAGLRRYPKIDGMKYLNFDKLPYSLLFILCLLLSPGLSASPPNDFPERIDPWLQAELTGHLKALGLSGAAASNRLAVALVDITEPAHPRLAHVNGHNMMYAASLPKIAILFGAYHQMATGKLLRSNKLMRDLTDMIRVSSNEAATRVLEAVGPTRLNGLLRSSSYRFYDPGRNGGLWVGKAYGPKPAFQRDPLHSISHGATPWQVARFYYLIEREALVSPQASREMKSILGNPGIHHKFVAGLQKVDPNATIYRKSGTWKTYHCDSAIVERNGRRYIAVALANDPKGGEWLKQIIVAMDDIIINSPQSYAAVDN